MRRTAVERALTGRTIDRPSRSAASTARMMRNTPSPPSISHATATPSVSSTSATKARTTTVSWLSGVSAARIGTSTSAPPSVNAVKACPSRATSMLGLSMYGAPRKEPSGKMIETLRGSASMTAWADSGVTPAPASSVPPTTARAAASAWASRSASDKARSAAWFRTSRASGTMKASTTSEVTARERTASRRLMRAGRRA